MEPTRDPHESLGSGTRNSFRRIVPKPRCWTTAKMPGTPIPCSLSSRILEWGQRGAKFEQKTAKGAKEAPPNFALFATFCSKLRGRAWFWLFARLGSVQTARDLPGVSAGWNLDLPGSGRIRSDRARNGPTLGGKTPPSCDAPLRGRGLALPPILSLQNVKEPAFPDSPGSAKIPLRQRSSRCCVNESIQY